MKIALCDDNYIQVKFIEDYLRAKKMDVDYYDSGEALVRAYRDGGQRYDAVFLDIEMQPVGGFETANIIYDIDDSVLIVFVTNHHQFIEEWFKFNGVWFLHKPVTEAALEEAVARLKKYWQSAVRYLHFKTAIRVCDCAVMRSFILKPRIMISSSTKKTAPPTLSASP